MTYELLSISKKPVDKFNTKTTEFRLMNDHNNCPKIRLRQIDAFSNNVCVWFNPEQIKEAYQKLIDNNYKFDSDLILQQLES